MSETVLAWHFLKDDSTTGQGGLAVEIGQTLAVKGKLKLCECGLHGAVKALDALGHAPGSMVQRVRHEGKIIHGNDKLASRKRTCLAKADATRILHEFACDVAQQALDLVASKGMAVDPRSTNAIAVKRRWVAGQATDAELDAAWVAARAAAWVAARAAAWAAARAAAWDAAWDAARAAARAAAWDAARAAAWDAARVAAWDAARAAARAAAWDAMNADLERRLFALLERECGYTEATL